MGSVGFRLLLITVSVQRESCWCCRCYWFNRPGCAGVRSMDGRSVVKRAVTTVWEVAASRMALGMVISLSLDVGAGYSIACQLFQALHT